MIYLNASPLLKTALDKVEAAGGRILVTQTEIPAGVIAVCLDTEGNKIGLHAAS